MAKFETNNHDPQIGGFVAVMTYFSYFILIMIGHVRDFFGGVTGKSRYNINDKEGYSSLSKNWESFFTRRLFNRIQDCWNRPLSSGPGVYIDVMDRISNDDYKSLVTSGKSTRCLNLGSYNYLGFADDWKETCRDDVTRAVDEWPISMTSSRQAFGTTKIHIELEELVARFVGKEAAAIFPMGYGTNTSVIPTLMGAGSLIISDSLNHTSIINGSRSSVAQIRVFKHNNTKHLEEVLREAIIKGQPNHHRPWTKIMVMVEGIYSMEGAICQLKEIVRIVKKYKAYIYVDEAHSIGALGASGRGICEYCGVDPADIDVLMGTFTKSFSGMGGYIAASRDIVNHVKRTSPGIVSHNSMSPVICQQIITAFKIIMGEDGTNIGKTKLDALRNNSNFFRAEMKRIGLHVYGHDDSPIIPVMLYFPTKIAAFSRECLKRGLAVVVVGFPATSVILSRARFCISAGHTHEDLVFAIKIIDEVADLLLLKYNNNFIGAREGEKSCE